MRKRNAIFLAGGVICVFVITFLMTNGLKSPEVNGVDERLVILESPQSEEWVDNPIIVSGKMKDSWFEEGMPNAILTNWDGLIIAEVVGELVGSPDSQGFQKFRAEVKYEKPEYNARGFLIVQKANPTRDPKKAAAEEVMIYFK